MLVLSLLYYFDCLQELLLLYYLIWFLLKEEQYIYTTMSVDDMKIFLQENKSVRIAIQTF